MGRPADPGVAGSTLSPTPVAELNMIGSETRRRPQMKVEEPGTSNENYASERQWVGTHLALSTDPF